MMKPIYYISIEKIIFVYRYYYSVMCQTSGDVFFVERDFIIIGVSVLTFIVLVITITCFIFYRSG